MFSTCYQSTQLFYGKNPVFQAVSQIKEPSFSARPVIISSGAEIMAHLSPKVTTRDSFGVTSYGLVIKVIALDQRKPQACFTARVF